MLSIKLMQSFRTFGLILTITVYENAVDTHYNIPTMPSSCNTKISVSYHTNSGD